MLTIYRRHVRTCAHRSEGRKYRRCRCPVTVAEAWQQYLADAEARVLCRPAVYKAKLLSRQMEAFAQGNGLRFLRGSTYRCCEDSAHRG